MVKILRTVLVVSTLAPLPSSVAAATDRDNARALCSGVDMLSVATRRCSVDDGTRTISLWIRSTGSQAEAICEGIVEIAEDMELRFASQWMVSISSEGGTGGPITCSLALPSR